MNTITRLTISDARSKLSQRWSYHPQTHSMCFTDKIISIQCLTALLDIDWFAIEHLRMSVVDTNVQGLVKKCFSCGHNLDVAATLSIIICKNIAQNNTSWYRFACGKSMMAANLKSASANCIQIYLIDQKNP